MDDKRFFIKISASGDLDLVECDSARSDWRFLSSTIGADSIEIVDSSSGANDGLCVDECFLIKDPTPPLNIIASVLYSNLQYPIHGDVLLGKVGLVNGEMNFLPFSFADALRKKSALCRLKKSYIRSCLFF